MLFGFCAEDEDDEEPPLDCCCGAGCACCTGAGEADPAESGDPGGAAIKCPVTESTDQPFGAEGE